MRISACFSVLVLACGPSELDCATLNGGTAVTFPPRELACEPESDPDQPCPLFIESDPAERTVCVTEELDGVTLAYVVDVIAVPTPFVGPAGRSSLTAVGFDLDGLDSAEGSFLPDATCEERTTDYRGVEPGIAGVDNMLSSLVPVFEELFDPAECPGEILEGCLGARLLEDIQAGELLLVLELTDVDSFENDPDVGAALYIVRTADDTPLVLDRAGRAVPFQRFAVREASTDSARGSIFDGRLRVLWPALTLPQSGLGYADDYTRVELRADVRETDLVNGVLGGLTDIEEFANETALRAPEVADAVRSVIRDFADVGPMPEDPSRCTHMSAAYTFQAMPAELAR